MLLNLSTLAYYFKRLYLSIEFLKFTNFLPSLNQSVIYNYASLKSNPTPVRVLSFCTALIKFVSLCFHIRLQERPCHLFVGVFY